MRESLYRIYINAPAFGPGHVETASIYETSLKRAEEWARKMYGEDVIKVEKKGA